MLGATRVYVFQPSAGQLANLNRAVYGFLRGRSVGERNGRYEIRTGHLARK
jgi:hypothetical protein